MRHLSQTLIDKQKWDDLVLSSKQPLVYVASWYLDLVCPDWEALVWEKEGVYLAGIPLPTKRFLWFKRVYLPYFVQQTGLVYRQGIQAEPLLASFWGSRFFKKYFSFQLSFCSDLSEVVEPLIPKEMGMERKKNYTLPLSVSYDALKNGFNDNRKRNLKKAYAKGWKCVDSGDMQSALEMYKSHQLPKQANVKKDAFDHIVSLYHALSGRGITELYRVDDEKGQALAYVLFIRFENRIYYFFGAMNEIGRASSASSLAFDFIIHKYSNQAKVLDFEGGNLEGIGHYFGSFGAHYEEYTKVEFNYLRHLIGHRK
jgi:hypothetical protein